MVDGWPYSTKDSPPETIWLRTKRLLVSYRVYQGSLQARSPAPRLQYYQTESCRVLQCMSTPRLTLNLIEGSVIVSFPVEAAQTLKAELMELMNRLKVTANNAGSSARANPQPPMEYQHTGDVFLEIFCNPNIWPSPFAAKVLITLRDDRIRLTTEAELSRLLDDLNHYLEQNS
jgi:hypothetical protein